MVHRQHHHAALQIRRLILHNRLVIGDKLPAIDHDFHIGELNLVVQRDVRGDMQLGDICLPFKIGVLQGHGLHAIARNLHLVKGPILARQLF